MKKIKLKWNKDMIHFSGRKHTKTGIWSAVIGIIVFLGFFAVSAASGALRGNGGILFGFSGFVLLALSVLGFLLSYKAFKQRDIFYRFPLIGALLNGTMVIILLIIYILGFGG